MSRMRTAHIRKEAVTGSNDSGSDGPDTMYVVDLLENGQVVESRKLPGKSSSYAQDVVENWENGIIQLLVD
jgi:hypothetical protein